MANRKERSVQDYGNMHDLNIVIFSIVAVIGIIAIVIFIIFLSHGISIGKSTNAVAGNAYGALENSNSVIINNDGTIQIVTPDGNLVADCYCPKTSCPDCKIRVITRG